MSCSDPISDLISRIRNGQLSGRIEVSCSVSKHKLQVLKVLESEGYIEGISFEDYPSSKEVKVKLRYFKGNPVIHSIHRISKPGCRVYSSLRKLPKVKNGLGIYVLSTSRGVVSDHEARQLHTGGEIICLVL